MSKWISSTLGGVSKKIITGPFGSQLHQSDYVSSGVAVIMPQNIGDRYVDHSTIAYISETDANRLSRYRVKTNDIVYSRRGDVEKHALVRESDPMSLCGTGCFLVRLDTNKVYPEYVSFYLNRPESRTWLRQHAVGSNMPNLNSEILNSVPFCYPQEIEKQKALVDELSSLDHKIQLNNAINAELEKVAKTLYNYWFVQFDFPNADGKPYRASGGKMVYNEVLKREIPEGWTADKLDSALDFQRGVEPGSDAYSEMKTETDNVPFIRVSDLGSKAALYISENSANGTSCKPSDVLVSFDGSVGKIGIAMEGAFSTGVRKITGKDDKYANALIYFIFQSEEIQKIITKYAVGSNILHASGAIEHLFFSYEKRVVNMYIEKVEPIYEMIIANNLQNTELITLRDFLLPLLMNGQVTVKEEQSAEKTLTPRQIVFLRLVLSAYILDNTCDEPTTGQVKFEKLLFLCLYDAKIPIKSNFKRHEYGPYDNKGLYSIEKQLNDSNWFQKSTRKDFGIFYRRLEKHNGYKKYIDTNFDTSQKMVIDKLLHLFKTARTEQCEIVATLYGAWNDFLIDGVQPNDEQIVNEVLTNWSKRKENIDRQKWFKALEWMREKDIIPVGYGESTRK